MNSKSRVTFSAKIIMCYPRFECGMWIQYYEKKNGCMEVFLLAL